MNCNNAGLKVNDFFLRKIGQSPAIDSYHTIINNNKQNYFRKYNIFMIEPKFFIMKKASGCND